MTAGGCGARNYEAPLALDLSGVVAEGSQVVGICSTGNALVGQVTCVSGSSPEVAHVRPCAPVGLSPELAGCETGTGAYNDCISGSKF
ncbi:MAG: hypothetical protein QUS11_04225 [Candidatus Fermentibacter sp.]|nr:hypothetical protein [Candidatus Fermentibacter sp.]